MNKSNIYAACSSVSQKVANAVVRTPFFKKQQIWGHCFDYISSGRWIITPNTPFFPPSFIFFFIISSIWFVSIHSSLSFSAYLHNILHSLSAFLCLSFFHYFLLPFYVLVNMLLYGCPVRKPGSLCVFTSCSVRMALPGGHWAYILKQVCLDYF